MTEPDTRNSGVSGKGVARWVLLISLICATVVFATLGVWQIERMQWKHELIARIEARVHADPQAAPGPDRWAQISARDDEYTRVTLSGTYRHDQEALVAASTERGPGYWVMTPFARDDGTTVIVNRGFVTSEFRDPATRADSRTAEPTTVVGLLRITESGQWMLRHNDPSSERWYRRDPEDIGRARGLTRVAPYFVDQEASATAPDAWPIGGMTRLRFNDNHLVYALTWFTLAILSGLASVFVFRSEFRNARQA